MIKRLAQIRTIRDAFRAGFVITAMMVVLTTAMTGAATSDWPTDWRLQALATAAWVSAVIGVIFVGWFVFSLRAIVRLNDMVDRQARTDDLTGLDNRRAFFACAERESARADRQGDDLSLLVLDIDHFKRVNDTHGHRIGDLVLAGVAQVLWRSVGEAGVVGRLGGEEFAVLLPGYDLESAQRGAETIRATVEVCSIATPAGDIPVTVSIGCASVCVGESALAAFHKADDALYAAKRAGRNQVSVCAEGRREADPLRERPSERDPRRRSA
jgi:diguanylate cyclase (GGDEF)-like protein